MESGLVRLTVNVAGYRCGIYVQCRIAELGEGCVVPWMQTELPKSRSKVSRRTACDRLVEEPLVRTRRFGGTIRPPTTEPRHKSYCSIA